MRQRLKPCSRSAWTAGNITLRPNCPAASSSGLLADEPTGNLDTQRSQEIMELLSRLNVEHRITVLMVTHEPDMAAYARRLVHFVDGHIDSDAPNSHPIALDLPVHPVESR